jgi:hypothetical protein
MISSLSSTSLSSKCGKRWRWVLLIVMMDASSNAASRWWWLMASSGGCEQRDVAGCAMAVA